MDDLTGLVEGALGQLGRTYLISGLVPALVGVAAFQYLVIVGEPLDLFPALAEPLLGFLDGPLLTTVVLGLVLAFVPLLFNRALIRLYEGFFPGAKLLPSHLVFKRLHANLYADVAQLRAERRRLLTSYEMGGDYDEERDGQLQQIISAKHSEREPVHPVPIIPFDEANIRPTLYGNAWSVNEEYPLTRYGIDSMVFWPYLRTVTAQVDPDLLATIDGQKLLMDTTLTFSFVMVLVLIGALVSLIITGVLSLLAVAAVALLLAVAFYRASIAYVRAMGTFQGQVYDLYRHHLLERFGLEKPDDLDDEYWVWQRLAAFIRRGEPFYFE
ncbi:MAG: hypothetical protein GYB64_17045, partial [Chloroflexi bacterium]|nr:hypothetical protein [Chloroflexota bacterium]